MPYQISFVVTNPDGQAITPPFQFTFNEAPRVTSISPSSGPESGGTTVTVSGQFLASGAVVSFAGRAATNVVVAPDGLSLTCVTPDMR